MRLLPILICCALSSLSSGAASQVEDSRGNILDVGQPLKPVKDKMGGTISRGRPAKCVIDDDVDPDCIFFPRNGDGSFALQTIAGTFWAKKVSPAKVEVWVKGIIYHEVRTDHVGIYTRSRKDAACWRQNSKIDLTRKFCVYLPRA